MNFSTDPMARHLQLQKPFGLLKESLAPGSETLERLYLPHLGRKFCSNLGIETGFRLDVAN